MKLKQIAEVIDRTAPGGLALEWDNVGLLVGDYKRQVKRILLTIDITKEVIEEAKRLKTELILSYHPVIWDGLKRVTAGGEGSVVYELVRSGISVYSIHTAFDIAAGGVNDLLAEVVGIEDGEPVGEFVSGPGGEQYKLVVFVPMKDVNRVADAIYSAGAGAIGKYSHCGFQMDGVGMFLPLEGAKPAIGKRGRLEKVNEVKLESVVSAEKVGAVVAAMRRAHPYEEVAFDVFRHYDFEGRWGLGRIGNLSKPMAMEGIVEKVKEATGARAIGFVGKDKRLVKKAAVCAGSCGKIINQVIAAGCDLYVTGELKHHHALAAQEGGLSCMCLSHTVSERFALKNLAKRLKKELKDVTIRLSKRDADPFKWKSI
jgi:dinuclear metal center YbgI/SA1388 family protein